MYFPGPIFSVSAWIGLKVGFLKNVGFDGTDDLNGVVGFGDLGRLWFLGDSDKLLDTDIGIGGIPGNFS